MIKVNPYMDKQIEIEEKYYDELELLISFLINQLNETLNMYPAKTVIMETYNKWYSLYRLKLVNSTVIQAKRIVALANEALGGDRLSMVSNIITEKHVGHDLFIELEQTLAGIKSRYVSAISTGAALAGVTVATLLPGDDDIEDLVTRSDNSLKKFVQFNTSEGVGSAMASIVKSEGLRLYQAGNQRDDRVREQHAKTNDFKTWHDLDNPPEIGLPGYSYGCRCYYTYFK